MRFFRMKGGEDRGEKVGSVGTKEGCVME